MKATKFSILICFLVFSGRFQAASFFSNLMSGHFSDDDYSEDEDGSDSHSVATSDEDYGYSDDDLSHPISKDGFFGLLSKNASALYEYYTSYASNVGTEAKNIPKIKRVQDQIVISTGAEEDEEMEAEIKDQNAIDTEKVDKKAEGTEEIGKKAEPLKCHNYEEIPTADTVINQNNAVISAEHVHHFDDSIVSTHRCDSEKKTVEISFPNELDEKTGKHRNLDINSFIEKANAAHFTSYDEARRNLRSEAVTTSPSYQNILNLLQESYMGEFLFQFCGTNCCSSRKN